MRSRRYRVNPFFDPQYRTPEADATVLRFHQSLEGYRPTPLHSLPELAKSLNVGSVQVKDESQRMGLNAYKVLGASWAVSRVAARDAVTTTYATATAGNHGRAVAWACRQLRKRAVIFVPASASPYRVEAIRDLGARIVPVEGSYDEAVKECARQSAERGWQVVSDTGYGAYADIPRMIMEGYRTLFREAGWQREKAALPEPNLVLIQMGVGGLAGAAVRHYFESQRASRPSIAVVEPSEADPHLESILSPRGSPAHSVGSGDTVMQCLNCATVSTVSWPEIRAGARLFLSIEDEYAERAMRLLYRPSAKDPHLVAGASGAAGIGGLLALAEAPEFEPARRALRFGPGAHVLAIVTEGDNDPEHFARVVAQ